jgi:hypothetical protein
MNSLKSSAQGSSNIAKDERKGSRQLGTGETVITLADRLCYLLAVGSEL